MQTPEMFTKNIKWGFGGHLLLCLFKGEGHQMWRAISKPVLCRKNIENELVSWV